MLMAKNRRNLAGESQKQPLGRLGSMAGECYPALFGSRPLPYITDYLLHSGGWLYLIPTVWPVGACVITFSKNATIECGLVFAGTTTLLIVAITGISTVGLVWPLIPRFPWGYN